MYNLASTPTSRPAHSCYELILRLGRKTGGSGGIIRLADELQVSIDHLVGRSAVQLDPELSTKINDLQGLSAEDRQHIMHTLGALIREAQTRKAFG